MATQCTVKFTSNFERNLEDVEIFLAQAEAAGAFDALLGELTDAVIPNLERFPSMGQLFLERTARSVEVANGAARLTKQLSDLAGDGELREYVMAHYMLLYMRTRRTVYLLSIRHHRQLSFDFMARWPAST